MIDAVGVRVQRLSYLMQAIALARIVEGRSDNGRFVLGQLLEVFDDAGLPRPGNPHQVMTALIKSGFVGALGTGKQKTYRLTPEGAKKSNEIVDEMDLAVFVAETTAGTRPLLGATEHPVIPPSLAPPDLVPALRGFFKRHPFETNVFGMTRFPQEGEEDNDHDPLGPALDAARETCKTHGLTFHLASDRQIVDDLWPNVAAHLWACKYAIAFFEDRRGVGINYNLSIEVGSAIVLGRRVAILKDRTIDIGQGVERLPTDLTGKIYKAVDLDDPSTVTEQLRSWIVDDLAL